MAVSIRAWSVSLFVLVLILVAASAWAAPNDNRNRQDAAKRQRIDELERKMRQAENELNQYKQQESQLNRQVQQLERELPAAKDKLKKAEGDMQDADKAADDVRKELDKYRDAVKSATQSFAEVGERIEKAQPATSPFGQARAAFVTARAEYQAKVEEVSNSAEYKKAYADAVASDSRAVLMPAVKKQYLDDNAAIVEPRNRMQQAKPAYEKLQQELIAQNPEYGRAAQALAQAKDALEKAEKGLRDATNKLATAKRTAAMQHAAVNKMDAELRRDKDAVKRLPGLRDRLESQIQNLRRERQQIR